MKQLLMFMILSLTVNAQEVEVGAGSIHSIKDFPSKIVAPRTVDVWLPDGYSTAEKYPVLYMHDGQMLFDPGITWNNQAWEADEIANRLMKENKVQHFIIVGIYNIPENRMAEYFPEKPFRSLSEKVQSEIYSQQMNGKNLFTMKIASDNYLAFIVRELKPFIDANFSTKTDAANTYMAGSSMGGLISLYAVCEYPEVFGGAACLSTHWPGTITASSDALPKAFFDYMKAKLPSPKNHKLYFDYGTETLDAGYAQLQKQADVVIKAKGYTSNEFISKEFPGHDHSEKSWSMRLHEPLTFLFGE